MMDPVLHVLYNKIFRQFLQNDKNINAVMNSSLALSWNSKRELVQFTYYLTGKYLISIAGVNDKGHGLIFVDIVINKVSQNRVFLT